MQRYSRDLCAEITSWQYFISTNLLTPEKTGRRLILVGETKNAYFLPPSDFCFLISEVGTPNYEEIFHEDRSGTQYGEMYWYDYDKENNMVRTALGEMEVSKERFNQILDLLLNNEKVDNSNVQIIVEMFGLELSVCSIEDDRWPVEKVVSITDIDIILSKDDKETKDEIDD